MKLGDSNRLLRGFGLARLAVAVLLLALGPMLPEELMPSGNGSILALALLIVVVTSGALAAFTPVTRPLRIAWLICLLDSALVTAVVAATGGARSIFAFLYVLSVTAACVLLSRTRGLAIAAVSSLLYTGIVVSRTVLPLSVFFEAPQETTALELVTMFLNAATLLAVAIVAGGIGERYRATRQELETQQKDLRDLQAFKDLIFQSVGTGLIALDREHRITAFNRAAEEISGFRVSQAIGHAWPALMGATLPLESIEAAIEGNPRASMRQETMLRRPDGTTVPVRMTFSALRSGEGERLGLISVCEDLSAIRAMETRMRQADRLATLGRMAANIAHEIRDPLASLTGAVEALTCSDVVGEVRSRLTAIVVRESGRLSEIIGTFLEYAHPAPLRVEHIDAAVVLDDVLTSLALEPGSDGVKIARVFAPSVLWP